MKKNFLFSCGRKLGSGVRIVTAFLLVANLFLPGIQAFATEGESGIYIWDYVWNEATWNASYQDGALKVYYQNNPSEDLWNQNASPAPRACNFNDKVYTAQICNDSTCSNPIDASLTTTWGETYQTVNDGNNSYLLTMSAKVGSNEIYQLYDTTLPTTCTIPDGAPDDAVVNTPAAWLSTQYCLYGFKLDNVNENDDCQTEVTNRPAGSYIPSFVKQGEDAQYWPDNNGKCLYQAPATPPQPTPSGIYVKLLSSSYSDDCHPTYEGWIAKLANAGPNNQAPWISIAFKQEFKGTIKFNYTDYQDGADVYPRGDEVENWGPNGKVWAVASIPGTFGNEYGVSNGETSFETGKLTITLLTPVACIMTGSEPSDMDVCYFTLAAAIDNAMSSDTIILQKDTDGSIQINKTLALDLNGHKINGTLTQTAGVLTINDGENNGGIGSITVNGGELILSGGIYRGGTAVFVSGNGSKATINGGSFTAICGNTAAVYAYDDGVIDIIGGEFYGETTGQTAANGGICSGPEKQGKVFYGGAQGEGENRSHPGTVNVHGGTFNGRLSASEESIYHIDGGTFLGNTVAKTQECSEFNGGNNNQPGCTHTTIDDYLVAGFKASLENEKYVVQPTTKYSQIQHDSDVTAPGTSTGATYTVSTDGYTMTVSGKIAYDTARSSNRYGIVITTLAAGNKNGAFSGAKVYLKRAGGDDYQLAGGFWTLYEEYPDYNSGLYWYPAVTKRNQTDYLKIVWAEGKEEIYTINVENAILDLPADDEVNTTGSIIEQETYTLQKTELVIPTYDTETTDTSEMFTVTIGTGDDAVVYEGIPASQVAVTETVDVTPASVATNSNYTAVVEGKVEINFGGQNAQFSKPLGIKIKTNKNAIIKVKHTGTTSYTFSGLTTNPGATCANGLVASAGDAYAGSTLTADASGYVTTYTCSASTFVAYTETKNSSSTSTTTSSSSTSGGGKDTYSCKNLPSNAVANNTKTPTSNTNYSYSTNTSKVCTFQCKSGYTWNEDDEICDKIEGTNIETTEVASELTDIENQSWYEKGNQKEVQSNGLTRELNNAYKFAYKAGITTMPSAEEANMFGFLNRIAMAKMLSQYAINILGKTPDTSKKCTFGDVASSLDKEYNKGVTLACQLGIMGVGISDFRPYDMVPRAEFATALSRMLYGLADGTDTYYSTHMTKLMKEGIISVADPNMNELRGYVMLMLMRSAGVKATDSSSSASEATTTETKTETNVQKEVENYFSEAFNVGKIYYKVEDLKKLLTSLGYYHGTINNVYDSSMIDAIYDFQIGMGILDASDTTNPARGYMGPSTRAVLNQKWAEYKATR